MKRPRPAISARRLSCALALLALAGGAAASPQLHVKAGCYACHMVDKKLVGPSYKDIAARYRGKPEVAAALAARVRKGGTGVWGQVQMPALDPAKVTDADLKAMIAYILAMP